MKTIDQSYTMLPQFPGTPFGKIMNRIVGCTTIFAIFWFIIDSIVSYQEQFIHTKVIIESLIIAIFCVDYVYRFIKSPDKKAFFRNIHSMIELMSFLPFLVGAISLIFVNIHFIWGLRVWKIFSFLRVERYLPLMNYARQTFKNHLHKFEIALLFFGALWIVSGIVMYYVEGGINHNFDSIPNALWRAIVTMSTTGYGDMYPVSSLGKFIASFIIFLGPIFLGIISSLTVLTFFDVLKQEESDANDVSKTNAVVCTKCFLTGHNTDANYCKQCGTILPHKLGMLKK